MRNGYPIFQLFSGGNLHLWKGGEETRKADHGTAEITGNKSKRFAHPSELALTAAYALAALVLIFSAIYNFGYILNYNFDLIWLFTPGDYTSLAVPALLPVALVLLLGILIGILYNIVAAVVFRPLSKIGSWTLNRFRRRPPNAAEIDAETKHHTLVSSLGAFLLRIIQYTPFIVFFGLVAKGLLTNFLPKEPAAMTLFSLVWQSVFVGIILFLSFLFGLKILFGPRIPNFLVLFLFGLMTLGNTSFVTGLRQGTLENAAFLANPPVHNDDCLPKDAAIISRSSCLVRSLERGIIVRAAGPSGQFGTSDDELVFRFHSEDKDIQIHYNMTAPIWEYWIDAPGLRLLSFIPFIANAVQEKIETDKLDSTSDELNKIYRGEWYDGILNLLEIEQGTRIVLMGRDSLVMYGRLIPLISKKIGSDGFVYALVIDPRSMPWIRNYKNQAMHSNVGLIWVDDSTAASVKSDRSSILSRSLIREPVETIFVVRGSLALEERYAENFETILRTTSVMLQPNGRLYVYDSTSYPSRITKKIPSTELFTREKMIEKIQALGFSSPEVLSLSNDLHKNDYMLVFRRIDDSAVPAEGL